MIESDINGIEKWNLVIYDDEKDFYWIRMGLGYLWSTYSGLFYVKLCHRWVTRRCGIAIVRSFWMGVFFPCDKEKMMKNEWKGLRIIYYNATITNIHAIKYKKRKSFILTITTKYNTVNSHIFSKSDIKNGEKWSKSHYTLNLIDFFITLFISHLHNV